MTRIKASAAQPASHANKRIASLRLTIRSQINRLRRGTNCERFAFAIRADNTAAAGRPHPYFGSLTHRQGAPIFKSWGPQPLHFCPVRLDPISIQTISERAHDHAFNSGAKSTGIDRPSITSSASATACLCCLRARLAARAAVRFFSCLTLLRSASCRGVRMERDASAYRTHQGAWRRPHA